jgi:hypothetical protein
VSNSSKRFKFGFAYVTSLSELNGIFEYADAGLMYDQWWGLKTPDQIISITYNSTLKQYVVTWKYYE